MTRYKFTGFVATLAGTLLCAAFISQAQTVQDLYRITESVSRNHVEYHQMSLAKGKETLLADLKGPGKLTYFYITDDTQVHWYPGLVLKVFWDDETEPSIQAPLADFFGAMGGKTIDYQSAPMQINHACYMCYLPMPFSQRARFVLANDGDRDYSQSVAYGLDYEVGPAFAQERSRLHCVWRRSNPVQDGAAPLDRVVRPSEVGGKNKFNTRHTILEAKGQGHYVGNFLQVHTGSPNWWGEGVTFFHRDGETMVHSPGTEDEYGSCWCFGGTFAYPYCGYLQNEKENHRVYRWYLANPVRFRQSLKVEIQSILVPDHGPFEPGSDDFTSIAYWYQEDPHQPFGLQPFGERTAASKAVDYRKPAFKVEGALEGEKLKVLVTTRGKAVEQDETPFGRGKWSHDSHLWWSGAGPGDTLDLALPIAETGNYSLVAQLTQAPDYAIVQLYLDGQKLGETVDLYAPSARPTPPLELGTHALGAGEHRLRMEITGANPAAIKAFMAGLDYVKLKRKP